MRWVEWEVLHMDDTPMRIAVKCKKYSFTMFYKTSMATDTVECKFLAAKVS